MQKVKFVFSGYGGLYSALVSERETNTTTESVNAFESQLGYKRWALFEAVYNGADVDWQPFAGLRVGRQLGENFWLNMDVAHYGLAPMSKGTTYDIVVSESPGWSTTNPTPPMESETLRARSMTWFFGLSLQYHIGL
jgi:hypothetical protein